MKRDFFRKVGFGIAPGESVPDDPLAWAQAQMDTVPDLSWKGDIPSSEALMDHYAHWIYTDQNVLRKKHKKDRKGRRMLVDGPDFGAETRPRLPILS